MIARAAFVLCFGLAVAVLAGGEAKAQQTGGCDGPCPQVKSGEEGNFAGTAPPLRDDRTDAVVTLFRDMVRFCENLPDEYHISCLRDRLSEAAKRVPRRGDYAPVRAAMDRAVTQLADIQRTRRDTTRPRQRFAQQIDGRRVATADRLRAIAPSQQAAANREAEAVITEMQTVLLRSAENSRRRASHYQDIAQAMGSTKILLRSA